MRERRKGNPLTITWIWAGHWIVILVLALLFLDTKVHAQSFEEGPYPGWHADQEYQERRQADLLEQQLEYQRAEERRRWHQESRDRARTHEENLRTNWGQGWDM